MRTVIPMNPRWAALMAVVSVILIVALAVLLLQRGASTTSAEPTLQGVAPESLARDGVRFIAPRSDDVPEVDEGAAIDFARRARPDKFDVIEVKLVRLALTASDSPSEQLVWAVNLDPETISPNVAPPAGGETDTKDGSDAPVTVWAVCFIDAKTGEQVFYAADYDLGEVKE